jgi:hypothetical protein
MLEPRRSDRLWQWSLELRSRAPSMAEQAMLRIAPANLVEQVGSMLMELE